MYGINVMLVEDDAFWIEHLLDDLSKEPDIHVTAVVSTKKEAIEAVQRQTFDVILMDINLTANNLDGIQAVKEITKQGQHKIIMLTSFTDKDIILESLKNGALNYITKEDYKDIVQAIRDAHMNRSPIHPNTANVILKELRLRDLSQTERIIYDMRDEGLSRTEIAEKLQRSNETIKTQIKSIKRKLNS